MHAEQDSRVFVVEQDDKLRELMLFELETSGFAARGFGCAASFLAVLKPGADGCLVTDVDLPGMCGLALVEQLARAGCHLVPVVITGRGDVAMAVRAMQAGAADFIEKPIAPGVLPRSVKRALATAERRTPLQRDAATAARRYKTLSEREREVFEGLVKGKLGKQIASDLGISPRTVEIHRARIMGKLEVSTLSELLKVGLILEIDRSYRIGPAVGAFHMRTGLGS